jgi:hypothetical protein
MTEPDDGTRGQELAMMMVEAIREQKFSSHDALNAAGNILVSVFVTLALPRDQQLEEFDNFMKYTRSAIEEAP